MSFFYESPWYQQYDPVVNRYLSAVLSAIPIVFFLVALTVLKMQGLYAAILTLVLQFVIAQFVFWMPLGMTCMSAVYGVVSALWPICYIIIAAVWLYKIAIRSGKFAVIRASVASVSDDSRIQVLLIAFCFGAFLEGACAFGTPIAICAAMLSELGFNPLKATIVCLVANVAAGTYGAIGIPVVVGAQQADLRVLSLSRDLLPTAQIAVIFVPAIMVAITDGFRGLKQTVPAWMTLGLISSGVQSLVLYYLGPELAAVIASLTCMLWLVGLMKLWSPSFVYREGEDDDLGADLELGDPAEDPTAKIDDTDDLKKIHSNKDSREVELTAMNVNLDVDITDAPIIPAAPTMSSASINPNGSLVADAPMSPLKEQVSIQAEKSPQNKVNLSELTVWEIIKSWSPFIFLTIIILIWSIDPFKDLFAAGGALEKAVVKVKMAALHNHVIVTPPIKQNIPYAAVWSLNFIDASGTALLMSVFLTIITTKRINFKQSGEELLRTCKELWKACTMICLVMAVAYVANFSGASATMGLAVSGAGPVFPLFSPIVGWIGVFITGSVVNNNVLFARLQAVTAEQIGVNPTVLVAGNTAGGGMGKAVSPQSIAIAAAAVGMIGQESAIMKGTLKYSLALTAIVCLCTYLSSLTIEPPLII